MRKAPPISTSSPRDTMASRPRASAAMPSKTAAALLLTTVAASAPVSSQSRSSMRSSRSPRRPVSRSNSRLLGAAIRPSTCCSAASASSARPRLVWMTVPVRFSTARIDGVSRACTCAARACGSASSSPRGRLPATARARSASSSALASRATSVWPCSATSGALSRSSLSRAGRSLGLARRLALEPWTTDSSGVAISGLARAVAARRPRRTAAAG
mmetsp:Transcript_6298/g.25483  ORF Transcript_6298/g.25483 Transcript_6298/m.25483 type:complete len:215 (+) Transcript_6298:77-721(+)